MAASSRCLLLAVDAKVHVYVSSKSHSVSLLHDERKQNTHGHHIGTLDV